MSEKNLTTVIRDSLKYQEQESAKAVLGEMGSWLLIILGALAAALLLNTFIIVNAQVTSGSMEHTIMTGDRVIGLRVSYWFETPQRGDIVFFKNPDDESEIFVKRVIGLPGETVEIKGGVTYIDGVAIEEPYLAEPARELDFGPYTFPEGCFFMMGDNRNNSSDSRYWVHTYVHESKILGKAYWIYYPRFESVE